MIFLKWCTRVLVYRKHLANSDSRYKLGYFLCRKTISKLTISISTSEPSRHNWSLSFHHMQCGHLKSFRFPSNLGENMSFRTPISCMFGDVLQLTYDVDVRQIWLKAISESNSYLGTYNDLTCIWNPTNLSLLHSSTNELISKPTASLKKTGVWVLKMNAPLGTNANYAKQGWRSETVLADR